MINIHDIISSIDKSLPNAISIASIAGFTPEESTPVTKFIEEVLDQVNIDTLSDREKLAVLRLHVKVRDKTLKTINIDDYVPTERQRLIEQL